MPSTQSGGVSHICASHKQVSGCRRQVSSKSQLSYCGEKETKQVKLHHQKKSSHNLVSSKSKVIKCYSAQHDVQYIGVMIKCVVFFTDQDTKYINLSKS